MWWDVLRCRASCSAQNCLSPFQLTNHRDMIFLLCLFPHIPTVTLPWLLFPFKSWEMEEQGKVQWEDRGPRTIPNASLGRSLSAVVLWLLLVKNNSISSTLLENYSMIKNVSIQARERLSREERKRQEFLFSYRKHFKDRRVGEAGEGKGSQIHTWWWKETRPW